MKYVTSFGLLFFLLVAAQCTHAADSHSFDGAAAAEWIQNHGADPVQYLVQKFENHNIVILGEEHRVHQFPQFVAQCIPALHARGVNVIAMEFENSINQPLIDSFLTLPWLDNEVLYSLRRRTTDDSFRLFKEYNDIFRKCWSFNQSLPDTATKMRIVALDLADEDSSVSIRGGERPYARDKHMFEILEREVLRHGEKVLVYCGWMHAMTHLVPPKVSGGVVSKTEHRVRLGNYLLDSCGTEVFSVFFYAPYIYTPESTIKSIDIVLPVSGQLEDVMKILGDKPVGFDMAPSPFAKLSDSVAFFRFMRADWTLADVCDGYLFLLPVSAWRVVSIEDIFGTDAIYNSLPVASSSRQTRAEYLKSQVQDAHNTMDFLKTRAYENVKPIPK
jgi:hypothetical protein